MRALAVNHTGRLVSAVIREYLPEPTPIIAMRERALGRLSDGLRYSVITVACASARDCAAE
jgi:hypothetical protein